MEQLEVTEDRFRNMQRHDREVEDMGAHWAMTRRMHLCGETPNTQSMHQINLDTKCEDQVATRKSFA
jgi:hypothetical protein